MISSQAGRNPQLKQPGWMPTPWRFCLSRLMTRRFSPQYGGASGMKSSPNFAPGHQTYLFLTGTACLSIWFCGQSHRTFGQDLLAICFSGQGFPADEHVRLAAFIFRQLRQLPVDVVGPNLHSKPKVTFPNKDLHRWNSSSHDCSAGRNCRIPLL